MRNVKRQDFIDMAQKKISYERLFYEQFHCSPSKSPPLDNYSKTELIQFIERLRQTIVALNANSEQKESSTLHNQNYGVAIVAENQEDLEEFQTSCRGNYLPVSDNHCLVAKECTTSFLDQYISGGIDPYHLEYAMVILLKNVQHDQIHSYSRSKTIILDKVQYKYQLKILIENSTTFTRDDFLTVIRSNLLGHQFFDNHDDHASLAKVPSPSEPQFVAISSFTRIACWPLPRRRDLSRFRRDLGVTHVLTLQNEREIDNNNICQEIQAAGITSIHLPIQGAELDVFESLETIQTLRERLPTVLELITGSTEEKPVNMLIHCAAGLHRTGAITYLLLRLCKFTMNQALLIIHRTRAITAREVAEKRISIVENCLVKDLSQILHR